jgi:hypothetical protein
MMERNLVKSDRSIAAFQTPKTAGEENKRKTHTFETGHGAEIVTGRTKEGNGGAEVGARRTTTWEFTWRRRIWILGLEN